MEFTFKTTVQTELVTCRLCKDVYFRPGRPDLVEHHLKTEHKIKLDNLSDSEEITDKKNEPRLNSPMVKSNTTGLTGLLVNGSANGLNASESSSVGSSIDPPKRKNRKRKLSQG